MKFNLSQDKGSYRLTFTLEGKRKVVYLGTNDLGMATQLKSKAEYEWMTQNFDFTFQRYKVGSLNIQPSWSKHGLTDSELFKLYVEEIKPTERNYQVHYKPCYKALLEHGEAEKVIQAMKQKLSPVTFNQRLTYLRSFGLWCVNEGYRASNPYAKIKALKTANKAVEVFQSEELNRILDYFKTYSNGHYHDFVYFLIHTGCRPSEAVGLRWKDVDFSAGRITIGESLSRGVTGLASSANRVRKERKNGVTTVLQMNPDLLKLLKDRFVSATNPVQLLPNSLVFPSVTGKALNELVFSQEVWKLALERLGIPYRKLYTLRHTFASHCIEQGYTVAEVAYMLGHKDLSMVTKTYGHLVKKPTLPNLVSNS